MYIHYHNANINTRNMTGNCIRLICIVKYLLFRNTHKLRVPIYKIFISQGLAIRSVFGLSRVIHFMMKAV